MVVHNNTAIDAQFIFPSQCLIHMMLKCLGYRIGPFDVENSLIADTRVAEVAVVGVPDKEGLRGEVKVLLIL